MWHGLRMRLLTIMPIAAIIEMRLGHSSERSGPAPGRYQKLSVRWSRARRGAAMAVGVSHAAPFVRCSYVC